MADMCGKELKAEETAGSRYRQDLQVKPVDYSVKFY